MNKIIFLIGLMIMAVSSQDILIINPNQPTTFKERRVCLTEKQFDKLDSTLADTARYQKQIDLLKQNTATSDQLVKEYQIQVNNKQKTIQLMMTKDSVLVLNQSLCDQKIDIYKKFSIDLQKDLKKEQKGTGVFNNTFWFASGTIVGTVVMYLGSLIVLNVK